MTICKVKRCWRNAAPDKNGFCLTHAAAASIAPVIPDVCCTIGGLTANGWRVYYVDCDSIHTDYPLPVLPSCNHPLICKACLSKMKRGNL